MHTTTIRRNIAKQSFEVRPQEVLGPLDSERIVVSDAASSLEQAAERPGRPYMAKVCQHLKDIRDVIPSALGCEECLQMGSEWVHLRLCRTCGHVGCCDDSPNRHATRHFHATRHPIIEGYDPPEGWGWCYVDEEMLDLTDRMTPHNGPIPRYV